MANYTDTLLNKNIKFLQGTQADLNKFFANSNDPASGTAQEGAFYLTIDTHRLYVGRTVGTGANAKTYPEEISTGIATVVDSGSLPEQVTTGAAHDGDFYYIKSSNVLAVYKDEGDGSGQWIQINSPTGISTYTQTLSPVDPASTPTLGESTQNGYVRLHSSIATSGGSKDSDVYFKAGDNVTLKPSTDNKVIEISSANSQSNLSVEEAAAAVNKGPVVLSDGTNLDTKVYFTGKNDTTAATSYNYVASTDTTVNSKKTYYTESNGTYTAVATPTGNPQTSNYYERQNIVTIAGPGVQGAKITALGSSSNTGTNDPSGFKVKVSVKNGDTSTINDRELSGTQSILDPSIAIGENGNVTTKFYGGTATLDVYTTSEVDSKIASAVTDELRSFDALHYKGTVASDTALTGKDDGTAQVGDVWKASSAFTYNGIKVRVGDLFIAQGDEHIASTDTSVVAGKTYYTRTGSSAPYVYTEVTNPTGNPSTSSYYEFTGVIPVNSVTWEHVPSGNEPLLEGKVLATNSANPYFGLEDKNISGDYASLTGQTQKDKRPLYVTIDNANSTLIKANSSGTADNFTLTLHHTAPSSGSVTTVTSASPSLIATSGTSATNDSLKTKDSQLSFTALSSITRDSFGHVTAVTGESIVLQHNYLKTTTATHSVSSGVGQILIGATDALGICNNTMTKGAVKIGSDTLAITAANDNTQLNLNLTWGEF